MNKQKTGLKQTYGDRTWMQFGLAFTIEPFREKEITEEWLLEQVSNVAGSLWNGNPLNLPGLFFKKIEASILRAVMGVSTDDFGKMVPARGNWGVQIRTYVLDLSTQSNATHLSDDRWGFFMIQKQGDSADTTRLFLDLYIYQE